ncbi:hypothetical protein D9M68_910250 [compost metagenome]
MSPVSPATMKGFLNNSENTVPWKELVTTNRAFLIKETHSPGSGWTVSPISTQRRWGLCGERMGQLSCFEIRSAV